MRGVMGIHRNVLRAHAVATAIVAGWPDQLPETFDGHGWREPRLVRCHEAARTVHSLLGGVGLFDVVDGHYGPYEHSWLASRAHKTILDVYAIGRHPIVQIVDPYLIYGANYREGDDRDDVRQEVIEHLLYGGYPKPGLEPGFWTEVAKTKGHPYHVRERT